MKSPVEKIQTHLANVYDDAEAAPLLQRLITRLDAFKARNPELSIAKKTPNERLSQDDVILITYGDQIREPGKAPLQTLDEILTAWTGEFLSGVHILPFYPYSSDDGFSVIDYRQVNPELGRWSDIERMGGHFRLMFDAVINHISQESLWFQNYLRDQEPYSGYFLDVDPEADLSSVVRPRTLPLLTPFETSEGIKHVWTTFSADQIDLNYGSPDLLLEVLDVLLTYVEQGAQLIRLDAIGFMWKEIGTSCIHLPQVHSLIKLMRAALDEAAPDTLLVTETNVPHAENISYFGNGYDEAQMVYNFTLPPLTLHAFLTGNAEQLSSWAATLETPSDQTTYFNFMASHDGIGLRPLEGILSTDEVDSLARQVEAHGGLVSYKNNSDGSQSPYELNIVYYDAINDPYADEPQARQVDRFMTSQAILLSLAGVPGIYVHSLFGSRNWREGVAKTGQNRTINRRKFQRNELESSLLDADSVTHQVFRRYEQLIRARVGEPAFHPNAAMKVLDLGPALFAFVRTALDAGHSVLCLHNVSDRPQSIRVDLGDYDAFNTEVSSNEVSNNEVMDLISAERFGFDGSRTLSLTMKPYQIRWLRG